MPEAFQAEAWFWFWCRFLGFLYLQLGCWDCWGRFAACIVQIWWRRKQVISCCWKARQQQLYKILQTVLIWSGFIIVQDILARNFLRQTALLVRHVDSCCGIHSPMPLSCQQVVSLLLIHQVHIRSLLHIWTTWLSRHAISCWIRSSKILWLQHKSVLLFMHPLRKLGFHVFQMLSQCWTTTWHGLVSH